ncbi:hypothetical protein DVH24_001851 [Malus domestica]|uniref:Uncharacterized protein n=1 Tax=Malus domestica TaxID=3750 RepID=A0A498IB21_MALDO|nr:hypothetical protein DVH24_001851 [Malus domestica]
MGEVWVHGGMNTNGFLIVSMPLENRNDCLLAVSVREAQCRKTKFSPKMVCHLHFPYLPLGEMSWILHHAGAVSSAALTISQVDAPSSLARVLPHDDEDHRFSWASTSTKEKQEITIEKAKCNKQKCITIVKALQLFGELSVGDRKRVDWVHHEQSSFEVQKPDMKCNFHNPVRPQIRQCPHLLSRPVSVTPLWFSILRFFQILRGFFNELHTSIRLLRLTGLKPSFSNIYSQIDLILTWQILYFNEKIWAIRAQCKASCKHGTKPRHSSTQGGSIVHFRLIGTCPPIIRFLAILLLQCSYKVDPLCMDSWLSAYPIQGKDFFSITGVAVGLLGPFNGMELNS